MCYGQKGGHVKSLREKVFQAVGEASTLFQGQDGVFDSDRALRIGEDLLKEIDTSKMGEVAELAEKYKSLVRSARELKAARQYMSDLAGPVHRVICAYEALQEEPVEGKIT